MGKHVEPIDLTMNVCLFIYLFNYNRALPPGLHQAQAGNVPQARQGGASPPYTSCLFNLTIFEVVSGEIVCGVMFPFQLNCAIIV
jgi:hypothetical protein